MLKHWMKDLKDDVPLTSVVMPGSHNAGSYSMSVLSRCQDKNLYEQALFGVRQFSIRLDTVAKKIVMAHSVSKGDTFENVLKDIQKALDELPDEFFILDICEYPALHIGPLTIRFTAEASQIDRLLEEYIFPSRYAFTDFSDISKVTVGDMRRSGKRYILYNKDSAYHCSKNFEYSSPWCQETYSEKTEVFVKEILKRLDKDQKNGIYCFQTQQTPAPFSKIGMKSPKKLNDALIVHFKTLIDGIKNSPERLSKINIISGDFMTDTEKCRLIVSLNNDKGNFV